MTVETRGTNATTKRITANLRISDMAREQRDALIAEAETLAARAVAFGRDLSEGEQTKFDELMAQADQLGKRALELEEGERRASGKDLDESFFKVTGHYPRPGATAEPEHPLAIRAEVLDALQEAIGSSTSGRWEARAALTTTNTGSRRTWTGAVINPPRLLASVAGVPVVPADSINVAGLGFSATAAAVAGVAEGATLGEFTSVASVTGTGSRIGQFSDLTKEQRLSGDAAGSVTMQHRRIIAKSMDKLLIDAAVTAAGAAVTGAAGTAQSLTRSALATVSDNTGTDPDGLVVIVHPGVAGLLETSTSTGGETLGQPFVGFAGAPIYPSSLAPTGTALVCDLRTSAQWMQAAALAVESDYAPKTSVHTVATSIIGTFLTGLQTGYAVRVALT